jgi:hypothetical protein
MQNLFSPVLLQTELSFAYAVGNDALFFFFEEMVLLLLQQEAAWGCSVGSPFRFPHYVSQPVARRNAFLGCMLRILLGSAGTQHH